MTRLTATPGRVLGSGLSFRRPPQEEYGRGLNDCQYDGSMPLRTLYLMQMYLKMILEIMEVYTSVRTRVYVCKCVCV